MKALSQVTGSDLHCMASLGLKTEIQELKYHELTIRTIKNVNFINNK